MTVREWATAHLPPAIGPVYPPRPFSPECALSQCKEAVTLSQGPRLPLAGLGVSCYSCTDACLSCDSRASSRQLRGWRKNQVFATPSDKLLTCFAQASRLDLKKIPPRSEANRQLLSAQRRCVAARACIFTHVCHLLKCNPVTC